ncbi:LysR family transcriptional regulator [Bacillus sp. B15-48]|uniref:LysR family transcriptional regulator n=1 Tax=Bacillus sp. B15-48 TaxID=1548601 RepID=UPI00193FFE71|nr:LysR family transcriptional regulator [Bacillus sp. B15-48]MBM4763555.1 LysR family transcriptional regulator [Bacillus sp. B15-48]
MELRQLKYLQAIIEEGSFSGAAKKLHMTQPPISQQLKNLENELGIPLIERTTKKVVATEAGKKLYEKATEILDLVELAHEEMKELKEGITGTLSIGTITTLGSELLPSKIQHFRKHYPLVNFQIHEGSPTRIVELLENRIVELGVTRLPINSQIYNMIRLPEEPMIAAMNHEWDISNGFPYINLSNLENKPLMLLRRSQVTSTYNHTLFDPEQMEDIFKTIKFEPTIISESDNIATLLNWAYHGIGIAIVPKSAMKLIPNKEIIFKEIINPVLKTRTPCIIWRKKGYLSTATRRFLEYFNV